MSNLLKVALRDQLSIPTWLVLGASLQSFLVTFIPLTYAALPAVTYLLYTITRTALQILQWVPHSPSPRPVTGGWYSAMPPSSLAEPQPIVVFILGAQSSHPLGILGPGFKEVGDYFTGIIKEAEENRSTSGYLGSSGSMLTMDGESRNATMFITYWRSLEDLAVFSKQGVHAKTMKWFYENTERYPHIGIMHETYNCPAGQHENIYTNFRPFGQVKTSWEVDNELGEKETLKAELRRGGPGFDSMMGRMRGWDKSG